MNAADKLRFLARTTYTTLRRPRLRRDPGSVADEYSDGWNQYWDYLQRAQTLADWLRIPGLEDQPAFFNIDGELCYQAFDSTGYYRQALVRGLNRHFPVVRSLTEYGAGLGRNLLFLKKDRPNLTLYGYELCKPGVEIARRAAEKFNLDCRYSQLNYVFGSPDQYVFPSTDVACTVFSLEQIPRDNRQALQNIHQHCVLGSIHVEPVPENYPFTYRGLLGRLDHWKVDYLSSFDRNARSLGVSSVAQERLNSSHNPLMYPSLYVLRK